MAMRINYMEELDSLRRSVKEMGEAVEASFDQLLSAVDSKDEDLEMRIISGGQSDSTIWRETSNPGACP